MKEIIGYISISYLVLSIILDPEQRLSQRWMKSEYAYGMYLYGFIVQQSIVQWLFIEQEVSMMNFHISFVVCVLITYFIAMLSYQCVSRLVSKIMKLCLG